jgi:hypothetical protein
MESITDQKLALHKGKLMIVRIISTWLNSNGGIQEAFLDHSASTVYYCLLPIK